MDEYSDEPAEEAAETHSASENADPPRPVRGLLWVFAPAVIGAAIGAAWSAYYSAVQHLEPATPILVGGAIGLGIGAFLWVAFPYKGRPHRRPHSHERDRS